MRQQALIGGGAWVNAAYGIGRKRTSAERADLLTAWHDLTVAAADGLALEQEKPHRRTPVASAVRQSTRHRLRRHRHGRRGRRCHGRQVPRCRANLRLRRPHPAPERHPRRLRRPSLCTSRHTARWFRHGGGQSDGADDNGEALKKITAHVADSIAKGATAAARADTPDKQYPAPAVLTDATTDMLLLSE